MVILWFVRSITFNVFRPLYSARKCCMILPSAIFALGHTQVHIRSSNCGNVPSKVKALINEVLSFLLTLVVPNVYLDNQHVWFWRNFNNSWSWGQFDVVEYLVLLKSCFDIASIEVFLGFAIREIWNTSNLEIRLRLKKMRFLNL